MLQTDGQIKFIDFGLSKNLNKDQRISTLCGTPDYMAPEILNHTVFYFIQVNGKAAYQWSVGILIYEFLLGKHPIYDKDPLELFKKIRIGKI